MSTQRIKKNDTVVSIAGVNSGKTGKVMQVFPARERAVVEGVNMVKKCIRKSQDNPQGGIAEKESPVGLSNLMLYCPDCKRGVKISRLKEGGKSARKCRSCGHSFDR
jgi:large subunit ribosomal protein L24